MVANKINSRSDEHLEVQPDPKSLIVSSSQDVDYADAFLLTTTDFKEVPSPRDCMIAFFQSFPKGMIWLLHLRHYLAKIFGLKTVEGSTPQDRRQILNNFNGEIGESIAIFEVLDKNERELLTGQKDKHLDFKLSFLSYEDSRKCLELITTVNIHNTFGKLYFALVRPIHRFYMMRILKKMKKQLLNSYGN